MFMKISKEMFDTFSTFNKKFAYVSAINLFFGEGTECHCEFRLPVFYCLFVCDPLIFRLWPLVLR